MDRNELGRRQKDFGGGEFEIKGIEKIGKTLIIMISDAVSTTNLANELGLVGLLVNFNC